jgi:hypothetical protein
MPRPTIIAIYGTIFGFALLVGLLIATFLKPPSLPASSFTTPTAIVEPLAASSHFVDVMPPTAGAPTAMLEAPAASATSAPTQPPPSPTATELVMPTVTPTVMPTISSTATPSHPTAAPKPPAFSARVVDHPTDAAVACGTSFASRIWGTVKDRAGYGIYRASVKVSSADGQHHFNVQTNDQGGFEVPGLGCTTWIVRLTGVASAPSGVQATELRVSLNGGKYSGAGVEFQQR